MKTVAIIQARMGSTRLPGKMMRKLGDRPVLAWSVAACKAARLVDEVVVATSTLPADLVIAKWCAENNISYFYGSETDVLSRFVGAATEYEADIVLRLTGDCTFLDPKIIDEAIQLRAATNADYVTNQWPVSFADGLDVECFTKEALLVSDKEATLLSDRDCVTQFMMRNAYRFKIGSLVCPIPGLDKSRWVLDSAEDWEFCVALASRLKHLPPSYTDILAILDKEPELQKINGHLKRNERFYDALATEPIQKRTYVNSGKLLARAEKVIPLGTQTVSKSKLHFPIGEAPLFLTHGDGAYVFDVDGNRYVDMIQALLPNILGYRDPDVDEAIRRQLSSGISFSLATELEIDLAEMLVELIPSAEMVRFGKNGSDVTAAAIRLSRAYTGRERVLTCSQYHGWSDALIAGSERDLGVPEAVSALTTRIPFGDFERANIELSTNTYAAIIVEPYSNPVFLDGLRKLADSTRTVLVFDEIITGLRWHIGGAQALYGIIPDLTTMGKALSNGMPLAALMGHRDIMKLVTQPDGIFFSGTYMGETLSLAAAIATIKKLVRENVPLMLRQKADGLRASIKEILTQYNLANAITIDDSPLSRLSFSKDNMQKKFTKEMAESGTLIVASNNLSFSHGEPEVKRVVNSYEFALSRLEA